MPIYCCSTTDQDLDCALQAPASKTVVGGRLETSKAGDLADAFGAAGPPGGAASELADETGKTPVLLSGGVDADKSVCDPAEVPAAEVSGAECLLEKSKTPATPRAISATTAKTFFIFTPPS